MMSMLSVLFFAIMPWIGLGAVLWYAVKKCAPYLPYSAQLWFAKRALYEGVSHLGHEVTLVREEDGRYTLAPSEFDPENSMVWVDYGNERKGFHVGGEGRPTLPFLNGSLSIAYAGVGALADVVSAQIGREAKYNYADRAHVEAPAIADGGQAEELGEHEIVLPENGVIADLRDLIYFTPFHARPEQLKRVEKNAKSGMMGYGNWSTIAQTGGMLAAFFLGAIVASFLGGDGGGSTPSADVIPMLVDTTLLWVGSLGVV